MWREEGFRGFMRGNGINCVRIVPYSAVQFTTYEQLKRVRDLAVAVWRAGRSTTHSRAYSCSRIAARVRSTRRRGCSPARSRGSHPFVRPPYSHLPRHLSWLNDGDDRHDISARPRPFAAIDRDRDTSRPHPRPASLDDTIVDRAVISVGGNGSGGGGGGN